MAKSIGKVTVPIFAKFGGREYEIGTIEIDLEYTAAGRVKTPTVKQFVKALRKAAR